jgi:hypothetical protein
MTDLPEGTDGLHLLKSASRRTLMVMALAVSGLILACLVLRVPTVRVLLDTTADAVTFSSDRAITISPAQAVAPDGFRLMSMGSIIGLANPSFRIVDAPCALSSEAAVELRSISLDRDAELTIRAESGSGLTLVIRGSGGLELQVAATSDILAIGCGTTEPRHLSLDGATSLRAAPRGPAAPLVLKLVGRSGGVRFSIVDPIEAAGLAFTVNRVAEMDSDRFRSSIRSGKIRLRGVPDEVELRPTEPLRLASFQGHLTELNATEEGVRISALGEASSVSIGPRGFEEELKPSLLGFARSLHLLDIISSAWGVLLVSVFVWGVWKRSSHEEAAATSKPQPESSSSPTAEADARSGAPGVRR